jgi:hypothetical protein
MLFKSFIIMLLLSSVIMFSGCTSMVSVSPSTMPITEDDVYTKLGHTVGRSTGMAILFIPFFPPNPSRDARDSAIQKGGGNALIEVTEEYSILYLFVIAFHWTTVEGTAVRVERKGMHVE